MTENEVNFRPVAYLTTLGLVMAIGMVGMLLVSGDTNLSLDQPQDIDEMNDTIRSEKNEVLLLITLDTYFIAGYTALFIGLYLILHENQELLAKIGLGFGMLTSISDVVENSIQYALVFGINEDWTPDPIIYVIFWVVAYFIDLNSYIAALVFGFGLISSSSNSARDKPLGLLLLLYAAIGFLAFFASVFALFRSLFFVVGLAYATITFYRM